MPSASACEYHINANDEVIFVDDEWDGIAQLNGAEELLDKPMLRRPIWEFISNAEIAQVYLMLFSRVRRHGEPVSLTYRCDHPSAGRLYGMQLSALDGEGVRLVTWLMEETERPSVRLLEPNVPRSGDVVRVCSWCNRVRLGERWVEVDDALRETSLFEAERVPKLTHGLCGSCADAWLETS